MHWLIYCRAKEKALPAGPRPKGEERRAAAAEEYHRLLQEGAPPGTKCGYLTLFDPTLSCLLMREVLSHAKHSMAEACIPDTQMMQCIHDAEGIY